jgi:hypothetical protein
MKIGADGKVLSIVFDPKIDNELTVGWVKPVRHITDFDALSMTVVESLFFPTFDVSGIPILSAFVTYRMARKMRLDSIIDPKNIPYGIDIVRRAKMPEAIIRASGNVRISSSVTGATVVLINPRGPPVEDDSAILSMRPKVYLAAPVLRPALRLEAKSI